jgi:hypothetical protein
LATIIQRKRIPALTAYLKEHNLSPDFALHPISTHSHTSTLLHLASSSSIPVIVAHLLSLGANPQVQNAAGKTPYEIAGDRSTRDRFRLARHTLGDTKWNWEAAKVGKPLTDAEIAVRDDREAREIAEAKALQAALQKRIADEAIKPTKDTNKLLTNPGGGRLGVDKAGGGVGGPPRGNVANDRGLTEEMKMRIERERRARAAEARFAKK